MVAEDVAAAVGRAAVGTPVNGIVEVAGPEQFRLDEFIRQGLRFRSDPRNWSRVSYGFCVPIP